MVRITKKDSLIYILMRCYIEDLKSRNKKKKMAGIYGLGWEIGSSCKIAIEGLKRLGKDKSPDIRELSKRAIENIRRSPTEDEVCQILHQRAMSLKIPQEKWEDFRKALQEDRMPKELEGFIKITDPIEERIEILRREKEWFFENQDRLKREYPNSFLAIMNNYVIDSDRDRKELGKRFGIDLALNLC